MNPSALPIIPALASSISAVWSRPFITIWMALGSDTAVGRVAARVAAACPISCLNTSYEGGVRARAWSRRASAAARAILAAPRISILFIFSAVSGTIIAISD